MRLGYHPVLDGIVELGAEGFLPIDLHIRPHPVELEGLTATARRERTRTALENAGFWDRANGGFGHFITPRDLEERPPEWLDHALQLAAAGTWRAPTAA